jgi:hypothetical protein
MRRRIGLQARPLVRGIIMNGVRVNIHSDANSIRSENSVSSDEEDEEAYMSREDA